MSLRPFSLAAFATLVVGGVRAFRAARRARDPLASEIAGAGAAPELAVAFIGRLYALGPAGWALVIAHADDDAAPRAGARAVLCAVLADLRLDGAERQLAREVASLLCRPGAAALLGAPRSTAGTAALLAALAVLVLPSLPARDFEIIYAPFAPLIPAAALQSAAFTGSSRAWARHLRGLHAAPSTLDISRPALPRSRPGRPPNGRPPAR